MISEGSCENEKTGVMVLKIQICITRINYTLNKKTYKNILQCYCFLMNKCSLCEQKRRINDKSYCLNFCLVV